MADQLRLFLIEDDDTIALIIRKGLERCGHQVTRCRSAADALIVLGHTPFDLVILDQILPDSHGTDLLRILAREGISVPVLMVTAHGDEELASSVLKAGALDYLVKDQELRFLNELPKRVVESVTRHRLKQTNLLLLEALESARDGILTTDLSGLILHLNRALEEMTGYSRAELLGAPVSKLKAANGPADLVDLVSPTVLARKAWQGELTLQRKDGTLLDVSLTVSPVLTQQGRLSHFVAILRDIMERKKLEAQLLQAQKMQSVGTLAGGVAHEFNNLLAGINGYAALGLREAGVLEPVREFLQHILTLSERAAGLTRQLLTFARKPALSRRPTSMAELVQSTADLVTRTLLVEVVLDMPADESNLIVLADSNQLQQALVNLALNARDALAARCPAPAAATLAFRLRRTLFIGDWPAFPQNVPAGDYVVVEVIDAGCGMAPEVLQQALDPFFTTKDVGQGTGLGLPVVYGIVQGHQGFLAIDSTLGRGTCMGLYLPRLTHPVEGRPTFEAGQVLEPEAMPGQSILVVDDEEAVQDVVRRFLEIAGHQVTCASNGAVALDLLQDGRHFDLVILDLMMPREDGESIFSRLRQRRPNLPILLSTGLPQDEPVPRLLRAGCVGLLRKPFRMNELWYAVKQALSGELR